MRMPHPPRFSEGAYHGHVQLPTKSSRRPQQKSPPLQKRKSEASSVLVLKIQNGERVGQPADMVICRRYGSTVNCGRACACRPSLMVLTPQQKTALETDRKDPRRRLYLPLIVNVAGVSFSVTFSWSHV